MSDNDLIRRGDVEKFLCDAYDYDMIDEGELAGLISESHKLPAVPQEMSAREYLEAEARMCRHYGLPCAFDASGLTVDKAIEMVEKFAREHPETDMMTAKYALPRIDVEERSEE